MTEKTISERAQQLLKVLIERYIRDGQPIGSKTLAEDSNLALSSATIRNVLADLEERGYIASPHTSAGRIPTPQGYRFFIDSLITMQAIDDHELQKYKNLIGSTTNTRSLLNSVSSLLSGITQVAGIVTMPRQERMTLRHVEFLSLSGNRVLVILVLAEQEVQNRIIYTDRPYSASELQQAASFITNHYAGHELHEVHKLLVEALRHDRAHMEKIMQTVIDVADKTFQVDEQNEDMVVAGQEKLFDISTNTDMQRLRSLFEAFSQKNDILQLLDHCLQAQSMQIFIGKESGYDMLDDCSVITAPYSVNDKIVGALGIIGPTRMPYEKVIPFVDITAKLLTAELNKHEK